MDRDRAQPAAAFRQGIATLKHVAERAGVGVATVTRVLKNNGYVARGRARVLAAVEETGDRVNTLAHNLKRQRSDVIGHPEPLLRRGRAGSKTKRERGASWS